MCGIAGRGRDGARKLLWSVLLVVVACLFGLTGLGFLTMSIFIELRNTLDIGLTALLMGIGLTAFAGALLLLAFKKPPKPILAEAPKVSPDATESSFLSLAAFTAAYVLARQFSDSDRD